MNRTTALSISDRTRLGFIIAFATAIIYSIAPVASRAVYADGADSIFLIILTTWFRAFALSALCLKSGKKIFPSKKEMKESFASGIYQAISIIGFTTSLVYISGTLVITIFFTNTLMLLFFMAWRREINFTTATFITTASALIGLMMVLDIWHKQPESNLIGIGLAFIGALATTSRYYVYGRQTKERSPAVVGAENFLIAAVLVSFVVFFKTPIPPVTLQGWWWAFVVCFSTTFGVLGMFYGISYLGSFRWSLFSKIEPIFTAIFSALLLNEVLNFHQYLGIAVVLGSLALYQLADQREKRKAEA